MKVALVYDRLNKIGGAERVLTAFHELFPDATWYTSFHDPLATAFTSNWKIVAFSFNRFPFLRHLHEWLPWLMPFIFESFDFSAYDLVISIGSAESKGIITKPGTFHLYYCLTPTRYLYSHASLYLTNYLYRYVARYLRAWDQIAATRPDLMVAISTQVKKRIKKYYNRESKIIFPPVDITLFTHTRKLEKRLANLPKSYFLVVSRLVPYKRLDILIRAFAQLPSHHLVIVGTGSESGRLRRLATANVTFLGLVPDTELPSIYQHATAYLQANEEDFGISMVEAQAAGIPVIAYSKGGACDIVRPGTGLLLPNNKVQSFAGAIDNFANLSFDRRACQENAQRFDQKSWKAQIISLIKTYVTS